MQIKKKYQNVDNEKDSPGPNQVGSGSQVTKHRKM